MGVTYIVEYRLDPETDPFWELSKAVPRDVDGNPVTEGSLGFDGTFEAEVIGQTTNLEATVAFLRGQTSHLIRVAEVSKAWEAARAHGPATERRVKPRPDYDAAREAIHLRNEMEAALVSETSGRRPDGFWWKRETHQLVIMGAFVTVAIALVYWLLKDSLRLLE